MKRRSVIALSVGLTIAVFGFAGNACLNEYNKLGRLVDENQKRVLTLSSELSAERAKQTELEIKLHTLETENKELKNKTKKYRAKLLKKKTEIANLKK